MRQRSTVRLCHHLHVAVTAATAAAAAAAADLKAGVRSRPGASGYPSKQTERNAATCGSFVGGLAAGGAPRDLQSGGQNQCSTP